MKILDIFLVIISNLFFVINQVAVKLWLNNKNVEILPINLLFFKKLFSWEIIIAFIFFLLGGFIWIGLLKKIDLTILYPLISISYIFSTIAGYFIFKESFSLIRYIGIFIIIIGVILVSKS